MDPRVAKLTTPKECEIFARNARARDREDLAIEAKHRAIQLNAKAYGSETGAELECLESVYAYEQVLSAHAGKPTKAKRTWQLIKRHGILAGIEREVERGDDTFEYDGLVSQGLEKYAIEAVVLRYPNLFSGPIVSKSEERMAQHGVPEES